MTSRRSNPAALALLAWVAGAGGADAQNSDDALARLKAGNERFAAGRSERPAHGEGARRSLAAAQSPVAVVVTCADSRVSPEHVFNCDLGELYVVRNAGNVVDPEALASIEHAASALGVPLGVVMGHRDCDAVRAAGGKARSEDQARLFERIHPALERVRREGLDGAERFERAGVENVHQTIEEVLRRSALVRDLVRAGRFTLVPARYAPESGLVEWLPPRPVPECEPEPVAAGARLQSVLGLPPHVALELLQAGHRRFLSGRAATGRIEPESRARLVSSQRPHAVVIACADARVAPEHLFDAGLGELFVVRVAGNVINEEIAASAEHAVAQLGASVVVVLGHDRCSTLHAAREPQDPQWTPSQRGLLARVAPSVAAARAEGHDADRLLARAAELNALRGVSELRSRSALVRALEARGDVVLLAALYELESGDLRWLAPGSGPRGKPAAAPAAAPAAPAPPPSESQSKSESQSQSTPPAESATTFPFEPAPAPGLEGATRPAPVRPVPVDPGPPPRSPAAVAVIGLAGLGTAALGIAAVALALRRRREQERASEPIPPADA